MSNSAGLSLNLQAALISLLPAALAHIPLDPQEGSTGVKNEGKRMMEYERDVDGCRMQAGRHLDLKLPPGSETGGRREQRTHQRFQRGGYEDGEFV